MVKQLKKYLKIAILMMKCLQLNIDVLMASIFFYILFLKNSLINNLIVFIDDNEFISSFHTNSTSVSRRSSQSSISRYAIRDLNKSEIPKFYDFLIRLTVSNGWAFQWINDPVTRAFFCWLNPRLKLPDRKQLAGPILNQTIEILKSYARRR